MKRILCEDLPCFEQGKKEVSYKASIQIAFYSLVLLAITIIIILILNN